MKLAEDAIARVAQDFGRAMLGDPRRVRRAQEVAVSLARVSAPLPEALGDDAAIEDAYRFANNKRVTFPVLAQAHSQRTTERAERAGRVFVIHDTTTATV